MWTHRSIGHDTPARREVLALFKLSWPVCTCSLLTFSFQFINMLGAGRLGKDTLAAVALANSYFNIVSYFVIGAATSIDTLVSQAYGRSDIVECQQWLIRSLIVFSAASLPLCGLLASAGPIFRFCNFREDMVEPAVTYLMRLLPGTPFFIWFTCLQKYQQSMNLMAPALGTLIVCSVVNVGATAWAVSVGQLTGLAWILTMARILLFAVMVVAFFSKLSRVAPRRRGIIEMEALVSGAALNFPQAVILWRVHDWARGHGFRNYSSCSWSPRHNCHRRAQHPSTDHCFHIFVSSAGRFYCRNHPHREPSG